MKFFKELKRSSSAFSFQVMDKEPGYECRFCVFVRWGIIMFN